MWAPPTVSSHVLGDLTNPAMHVSSAWGEEGRVACLTPSTRICNAAFRECAMSFPAARRTAAASTVDNDSNNNNNNDNNISIT